MRTSILRVRTLKKYMNRKPKSFHYTMGASGFNFNSPSPLKINLIRNPNLASDERIEVD